MDITRTITGRDNRDMVSSIGEVVCQPMGYFWDTADHGRVLIGDDHDTHGYRSILVGTRGGVGPGGGLVLSYVPYRSPSKDKHKAPTHPHHRPLSLRYARRLLLDFVSYPSVAVSAGVPVGAAVAAASFSSSASSAFSARVAAILRIGSSGSVMSVKPSGSLTSFTYSMSSIWAREDTSTSSSFTMSWAIHSTSSVSSRCSNTPSSSLTPGASPTVCSGIFMTIRSRKLTRKKSICSILLVVGWRWI